MNAEFRNRQLPYTSPLANVLVVVVGAIAIAVSFVIGIFAFIALAAAVIVLAAAIGVRLWWLGLKARKSARSQGREAPAESAGAARQMVIEGEYHVIPGENDGDKPSQT